MGLQSDRDVESLAQRTVFLATLHGELGRYAPRQGNLLRVYHWGEWLDSLNIRLYAATLVAERDLPPWQKQLAVTVLAETIITKIRPTVGRLKSAFEIGCPADKKPKLERGERACCVNHEANRQKKSHPEGLNYAEAQIARQCD